MNNLMKETAFPDRSDAHEQRARAVDRSTNDRIAFALLDGHGLAGDQRLIDTGMTADHRAVGRDALAGSDSHMVAKLHFFDGQLDLLRAAHDASGFGLQVQEALHRLRTARLDDEREPFREDVVSAHHHRDGKECRGRIARSIER